MAMMLEYKPGSSLVDPFLYTVTRATPTAGAYRIAKDGMLRLAAPNVLRDAHYPFGFASGAPIGPRTTLAERPNTNSILQSQTLATGPWGGNNVTATNAFSTAPDTTATSCKLLPNTTNSTHYWTQNLAITANEWCAVSIYMKADGYTRFRLRLCDSGTTTGCGMLVNMATGTIISTETFGTGTLLNANLIPLANGWFRAELAGKIDAVTTSGNLFVYMQDNSGNDVYAADGVSFFEAWGAQFQRFGTAIQGNASSYIPTTTTAQGSTNDIVTMTWPFQTMPMWVYVKCIDLGWSRVAEFGAMSQWTNAAVNSPILTLFTGSGSGGQTPNHRFNYRNGLPGIAGANQSAAAVTPGANPYDTVELFCRVFKDASTEIQRSINGAAVVTGSANGASPDFFDIASEQTGGSIIYSLVVNAQIGLQVLRVGADPTRLVTLAQGAAA